MGDYIESTWKDNRTTGYGIQRVWTNEQAIINSVLRTPLPSGRGGEASYQKHAGNRPCI